MAKSKVWTQLFHSEGKDNLSATIRVVTKAAIAYDIRHVVVFTGDGESVIQLRRKLPDQHAICAVTFPHEMTASSAGGSMGIPSRERRIELESLDIPIVQGAMPFRTTSLDNETFRSLRAGLNLLGGGAQLCIQAVLMACDAGYLDGGQRCVVMSADTAMIMRAGHTWNFFDHTSSLAIEHVLCKPQYYQISRGEQELEIAEYYSATGSTFGAAGPSQPTTVEHEPQKALPQDSGGSNHG